MPDRYTLAHRPPRRSPIYRFPVRNFLASDRGRGPAGIIHLCRLLPGSFLERLRYQPGGSAETGDPGLLSATRIMGSGLVAVFQAHRIACIGSRLVSNVSPLHLPIDEMESHTSIVRIAAGACVSLRVRWGKNPPHPLEPILPEKAPDAFSPPGASPAFPAVFPFRHELEEPMFSDCGPDRHGTPG